MCERLDQAQLRYCVLRDPSDWQEQRCEVDLLVDPADLRRLTSTLAESHFVKLTAWGRAPHHFFVAYAGESDAWLKLDVVTRIDFGYGSHALRTELGKSCLARHVRAGGIPRPSPEDDLLALLLHSIVDKRTFSAARQVRIRELRAAVTAINYLSDRLHEHWPSMTWDKLAASIDAEAWDALIGDRRSIESLLARRDRLGTHFRRTRDFLLRKMQRAARLLWPRTLSVAVLAPDGAGKSTLIAALQKSFYFSVHAVYMGLYSRDKKTAGSERRGLAFLGRILTQWRRCLEARLQQARGSFVVFDRYSYDALLPASSPLRLGSRLRRLVLAHACPAPDLVVVLDAPGSTLFARKGEHSPGALEHQRQAYLALQAQIPQMVVVDATREAHEVCRQVTSLMWRGYADQVRRRCR